ncbi:polysaccharide biosynthesis protein [Romboutsia lituseburensis]|nr:nucleoside-diphosphate sugar epimerase/dehydratase [Romboutsia lituseburensis]
METNISNQKKSRVLIIGAGSAGELVINEICKNLKSEKLVIGIVDDDIDKVGKVINNIPIIGTTEDIKYIVEKYNIDEIIFSIADISKKRKHEILSICDSARCGNSECSIKVIPGIFEIINGAVDIKEIKDVKIEDLLFRETIDFDLNKIGEYLNEKVVLVTGGGGSIGSEICRQISNFNPKLLIILDNYENNAYDIQQELIRKYADKLNIETIVASIREEERIKKIFEQYHPDIVFHAAAHKHVPLMEDSPGEAIKNNIFGTLNVANLSKQYNVEKFVLISTDKAVNPTSIMGATKRAAEIIIQTLNEESKTKFVAVRFGNVLGSNGSVIPLFKKQIQEGGPVTITHKDIIRYFMTITEAVQLVIQAGSIAKGGEIFILDMGQPVKIDELAKNLIRLSGFEPGVDIDIEYIGLRPGEKLYEELLMDEEKILSTENRKIYIANPIAIDKEKLTNNLIMLKYAVEKEENDILEHIIKKIVTNFVREEEDESSANN